jgi:hypothetical protein
MSRISNGRHSPSHRQEDPPSRPVDPVKRARRMGILGVVVASVAATGVLATAADGPSGPRPVSTNLVANGDFAAGLAAWTVKTPGRLSLVAGRQGGSAVRLSSSTTATVVLNDAVNTVANTSTAAQLHVTAWIRTSTPNVTAQLRVREVASAALVGQGSTQLWLHDTSWHQIGFDYTPLANGDSLDLNVVAWQLPADKSLDIDDVSMTSADVTATPAPTPTGSATPTPTGVSTTVAPPRVTETTAPAKAQPTTTTPAPTGKCKVNAKLVPSCGVLWGIYTKPTGSEGWEKAFTNLEAKTDRQFDIVKRYHDWSNQGGNGQFPDKYEQALGASGDRILYFAWVSNLWSSGSHVMWKDIAAGKYDDSVILPQAQRFKAWKKPVFMGYDHEADGATRTTFGSSADYVAAYRHIHDVLQGAGVTNVVYVYNPTGYLGNEAKISAMYPGDKYVDWIAYDPYNFYLCHRTAWKAPEQTFSAFYDYLEKAGLGDKPFMLGEYGSGNDPQHPSAMGDWYSQVAPALKQLPNIKAAIMWDSTVSGQNCDFRLSVSPHTLQGFAESGLASSVQTDNG